MSRSMILLVLLVVVVIVMTATDTVSAFSPIASPSLHNSKLSSMTATKIMTSHQRQSLSSSSSSSFRLRMAGEEGEEEQSKAVISPDGTFYDDEIDSAPVKDGLSDSMKARLMAEASTGLDSDKAQTNVLLYIILGVGALVVLGGAGIFY